MLQLQMLQAVTKHARRPEYKGKIGLTCLINTDPKVLGFGITSHSYPFVQPTFGVFLGRIARFSCSRSSGYDAAHVSFFERARQKLATCSCRVTKNILRLSFFQAKTPISSAYVQGS